MTAAGISNHSPRIKDISARIREVKHYFVNCEACGGRIVLCVSEKYKILNATSFFSWRKQTMRTWACAFDANKMFREFQVPPKLKEHGVFRIAKEGSTILIQMMNGSGSNSRQLTPIRFDIEPSWQKTAANFGKQSKGLIADLELKQALIFYLSEQWLNLILYGNGHTSTTTFTDKVQGVGEGVAPNDSSISITNYTTIAADCVTTLDPSAQLDPYILDRDYAEFAIKIAKKTVKKEDALVRQLFYVGLSKNSPNPINLAILAPTSEGKTYAIMETSSGEDKEGRRLQR
jgi:hypothetical protein